MVDIGRQRPAHFGDATLRNAPRDLHLPEAQMGMNNTQGYSQIVIATRFNEGNLVIVPIDRHGAIKGHTFGGDRFEARRNVFAGRQRRQNGASGDDRTQGRTGDQSYPAGNHVQSKVSFTSFDGCYSCDI